MTAQEILKLIETVDPSDENMMDEIDAREWFYLKPEELKHYGSVENYLEGIDKAKKGYAKGLLKFHPDYSRDRNALKSIRPEGWFFASVVRYEHGFVADYFTAGAQVGGNPFLQLPTEELAELHAIIQALARERKTT